MKKNTSPPTKAEILRRLRRNLRDWKTKEASYFKASLNEKNLYNAARYEAYSNAYRWCHAELDLLLT